MNIYLGLVHYPVKGKHQEEIVSSVTNLDIHDIARTCKTFGVERFFIITPLVIQQQLVARILAHWQEDQASIYNPDRHCALQLVRVVPSIQVAQQEMEARAGQRGYVAVTGASFSDQELEVSQLRQKLQLDNRPLLLLFGTGQGLSASVMEMADFKLAPIQSTATDGYNHLSVRSAVAIYCDRFFQEASDPK